MVKKRLHGRNIRSGGPGYFYSIGCEMDPKWGNRGDRCHHLTSLGHDGVTGML